MLPILILWGKTKYPTCNKTGYWKTTIEELVKNAGRKGSDYDCFKADKEVNFLSTNSQIVIKIIIILSLNY